MTYYHQNKDIIITKSATGYFVVSNILSDTQIYRYKYTLVLRTHARNTHTASSAGHLHKDTHAFENKTPLLAPKHINKKNALHHTLQATSSNPTYIKTFNINHQNNLTDN
ncbi:MAG: hypothetical protein LBH80_04660 [Prevotellaceae bacterium]|nr:hypothetical protein [Prevotellaceae bacterium]